MKKIIYFISVWALLFLVCSCEEKEGTLFDFGGKDYASFRTKKYSFDANPEGKNVVYLYHLNDGNSENSTFTVSVDYNGVEDLFAVSPTQITFGENSNQAAIEIRYDRAKLVIFEPYTITLSIPQQNYPGGGAIESQDVVVMLQPVWEHFADGVFESGTFGESWSQEILKAEGLDVYKLPSLYTEGVDFMFKLEDETTGEISIPGVTPDEEGLYRWETGVGYFGLLDPDTDYTRFDKVAKNANFNSLICDEGGPFDWYDESLTW